MDIQKQGCLEKKKKKEKMIQSAHKRTVMPKKVSLSSPESPLTHSAHSHCRIERWTKSCVQTGILTKPLDAQCFLFTLG